MKTEIIIRDQRAGRGSPLVKAALLAGCAVHIAHVYANGSRTQERQLKNRKDVTTWCPMCGVAKRPIPRLT